MKFKKLLISLVLFLVGFTSLSALTIGGKYIGDFEVGISQGFPIEFEKVEGHDFEKPFYDNDLFVTSTGFNTMWTWRRSDLLSIGANLSFDWSYTNKKHGIQPSMFTGTACNYTTYGSSFYFKVSPAFKFSFLDEKMDFVVTPGFAFSSTSITRDEKLIDYTDQYKITLKMPFVFGLGVGAKAQYNLNKYVGLNLAIDFDFMLVNGDASAKASDNAGHTINMTQEVPKETMINIMPKIGVVGRF